jgi:hypothetical protein
MCIGTLFTSCTAIPPKIFAKEILIQTVNLFKKMYEYEQRVFST